MPDFQDDEPEEVFAGRSVEKPFLSIVIPTHQRPELLREAVACALGQEFDRPFEVIVVDDDPTSLGHELLMTALPQLRNAPLRYLRNRRNIGMFNNINRGIVEARGEWVTILHDDDLLDRSWAREMFAVLNARPDIDGLMCRRANLDQRSAPVGESWLKSMARRAVYLGHFGFSDTRRIDARKLFWEWPGNTVGFVARRRDFKAAGSFNADEHPCSDHFFYLRFSEQFRLHEYCKALVSIRIADNSLLRRETHLACAYRNQEVRFACIAAGAPRWGARLLPLLTTRQVVAMSHFYQVPVTPKEICQMLGLPVVRDRPLLLWIIRAACGGF